MFEEPMRLTFSWLHHAPMVTGQTDVTKESGIEQTQQSISNLISLGTRGS